VTLRRDVPVELGSRSAARPHAATDTLATLFTELEFRTLIPKLGYLTAVGVVQPVEAGASARAPAGPRAVQFADPRIVDDPADLRGWSRSSAVHDRALRRSLVLQAVVRGRARRPGISPLVTSRAKASSTPRLRATCRRSR